MTEKDRELRKLKEQNEALKEEYGLSGEKKVKFPEKQTNQNGKRLPEGSLSPDIKRVGKRFPEGSISPDSKRHIQELIAAKRARRF